MTKASEAYELVELNEDGTEDQWISLGTFEGLSEFALDNYTEADDEGRPLPIYWIRPAR